MYQDIVDNSRIAKAGHRSKLASLRFCVIAATGRRRHTQVDLLWITWRIQRISAFPINSERLDASVFTSMLPATKRKSRTCATRATDVISERKFSKTPAHTGRINIVVYMRRQDACWHGTRIYKRKNARSTCRRL